MRDYIFYGMFICLCLVAVAAMTWFLIRMVEEVERHYADKRFKDDIRKAVLNSQPTWLQMCDIAEDDNVPKHRAYQITRRLVRDVRTGIDKELNPHLTLLEGYMAEYTRMEPFDGLPAATHLSLERLRKELGSNTEALHPLIVHLKELLTFQDKKNARQRLYTFIGCLTGVVGVIFGVFGLL